MHKTHKQHHFTSRHCHCEQSRAIHIPAPCSQGEDRRGSTVLIPHHPQSGRAMVEMLGVLAIVGVLSVGAIGGYSYAMNKHRTNELIYEATKQAQWAGTQKEMNRSADPTVTGGSFGGGKISPNTVAGLPDTQIGILLTDLDETVCDSLIKSIEQNPNGVVKAIRDESGTGTVNCESHTASLIFNRDLSTGELQEGSTESENEQNEEPSEPTLDCGAHGEQVGNACECDTGWQGDDCSEQKPIDQNCSGHGYIDYYTGLCQCNTGDYGYDCSEQTTETCDDNSDCGSGYFCMYYGATIIDCTDGPSGQGKCVKVSGYRGGTKNGFTWSNIGMDWFSAENFCAAQNKDMPTIDSFECYKDGTSTVFTNGMASPSGSCCKANGTTCNYGDWTAGGETRSSKFASKIASLKSTVGGDQRFWTQSLTKSSCLAFFVNLFNGAVSNEYLGYTNSYALCE